MDLGSDLAGSIRIPAAYCGVAGLKATEARLPIAGHIPPLPGAPRTVWHMLSLGVLARCVADLGSGPLMAAHGMPLTRAIALCMALDMRRYNHGLNPACWTTPPCLKGG